MKRLTVLLLSSAFGLLMAIALLAGHPSAAFASPGGLDNPTVSPIGVDHTTGVDEWMPNVAPAAPIDSTVAAAQPTERSNMVGPSATAPPAAVSPVAVTAPVGATPPADTVAPAGEPTTPLDPAVGIEAPAPAPAPEPEVAVAVTYALAQVGRPYRYAASGPFAFDCSGLTMAAYSEIGVALPHRSQTQARMGRGVDWQAEEIRPGDLIVTGGAGGRAGHIGMAISATEWVAAPYSGRLVTRESIPFGRIQAVRRLIEA
jgi:cell wall-associated NlpC family hydrolase